MLFTSTVSVLHMCQKAGSHKHIATQDRSMCVRLPRVPSTRLHRSLTAHGDHPPSPEGAGCEEDQMCNLRKEIMKSM